MSEYKKRPKRVCSPERAVWKARRGIQLNCWELEELARAPEHAVEYARVIGGRFAQAEEFIAASPHFSFEYVRDIVKGRWEHESVFLNHLDLIPWYCVLRGRWSEAEERLLGHDIDTCLEYHKNVMKGERWEALENLVLGGAKRSFFNGWDYWLSVLAYVSQIGCRWEGIEARMLEKAGARSLFGYSKNLGSRLPGPLHQKMMLLSFEGNPSAKRYLRYLDRLEARFRRYLVGLERDEALEFLCGGTNSDAA